MLMTNKHGLPGGALQGTIDVHDQFVPVTASNALVSDFVAFTTTTKFAGVGSTMAAGTQWILTLTAPGWYSQGSQAAVAATKGAGSAYLAAGVQQLIDGAAGACIAVLQDSAGGNASLVQVTC